MGPPALCGRQLSRGAGGRWPGRGAAGLVLLLVLLAAAQAAPQRIVSLNVCADSMLLELVEPRRIASLTRLSLDPAVGRFHRRARRLQAAGMHFNRGLAEEVLPLAPDLVVAMGGAAPFTRRVLERLGLPLLELEPGERLASYRRNLRRLARALGVEARAAAILAEMDRRATALAATAPARRPGAMVLQPGGFTAGEDTLIDDVLALAGLRNLAAEAGLRGSGFLSLEAFVARAPALLIVSEQGHRWPSLAQQALRHTALRGSAGGRRRVVVPARQWTCGGRHLVAVAERLARARDAVPGRRSR